MNESHFKEATRSAERAVAHMPAGELKAVAFRVALERYLDKADDTSTATPRSVPAPRKTGAAPNTLAGRILALREDAFFDRQRGLSEVRDELGSRGWHYPLTTLSGVMQRLVRNRELRRTRASEGAKKTWKYSNP